MYPFKVYSFEKCFPSYNQPSHSRNRTFSESSLLSLSFLPSPHPVLIHPLVEDVKDI